MGCTRLENQVRAENRRKHRVSYCVLPASFRPTVNWENERIRMPSYCASTQSSQRRLHSQMLTRTYSNIYAAYVAIEAAFVVFVNGKRRGRRTRRSIDRAPGGHERFTVDQEPSTFNMDG